MAYDPPLLTMPDIGTPGVRKGRSVQEGYQRGWGLQFGPVREMVRSHALFKKAMAAAYRRTLIETSKLENLFLIITGYMHRLPCRNIVEFGVFRGGSSLFMATLLAELYPEARLYALDTFAGMPETDGKVDAHSAGDFTEADLPGLHERIQSLGLTNIDIRAGRFETTFPAIAARKIEFGLAHIDCDIYSAVKYSQDAVWPHMVPGGYVAYDDATVSSCIGATQAVEELIMERGLHSEQIWPHFVFRAGLADTP